MDVPSATMTKAFPTPPASPPPMSEVDAAALRRSLDALLERYLHLLDEQQTLQQRLGKHMSAGFFSLARANQSCPPGRRYGQDYYDERMKANRKIQITLFESSSLEATSRDNKLDQQNQDLDQELQKGSCHSLLQPLPVFKLSSSDTTKREEEDGDDNPGSPTNNPIVSGAPSNSLRWFGILVPPPLRSAQASFTSAVEDIIPALASVLTEMRAVEAEVEEMREKLGLVPGGGTTI